MLRALMLAQSPKLFAKLQRSSLSQGAEGAGQMDQNRAPIWVLRTAFCDSSDGRTQNDEGGREERRSHLPPPHLQSPRTRKPVIVKLISPSSETRALRDNNLLSG